MNISKRGSRSFILKRLRIEQINPIFEKYKGSGITVQFYERGATCYDPKRQIDNPPAIGDVYRLHLYTPNSPGTDPRIWTLQTALQKAGQPDASVAVAD